MDKLTQSMRSWNMSQIKSTNTGPEKIVRTLLRSHGYKLKYNVKTLPGKPDLVLIRHKLAIFVHGCFWHRHKNCRSATTPKSNTEFWINKFQANCARDNSDRRALLKLGYRSIIVWACQLRQISSVLRRIRTAISK